jgi:hypothetical protein
LDVLGSSKYMQLTTFRKDGTPVATPVWVARAGDELRVWSAADAGKVKRIRRSGAVQVAPCTARGKPSGAPIDAVARMLPDDDVQGVLDALTQKYGLLGRLATWRDRRGGRQGAAIAITLPG